MIDIHTHILPCLDDGSSSMAESIRMARLAVDSGVSVLIATPHCNVESVFDNYYNEDLEESLQSLTESIQREQIPLKIVPGMEVYGTAEVPLLLREGKLITLNHSRYLLLEFDFQEEISLTDYILQEVIALGYTPIIAHPERYHFTQRHHDILYEWIERGCHLQINKGSIFGSFGQRAAAIAQYILDNNLASFVASDAHGFSRRTTDLSEVYRYIRDYYSKEYADTLLKNNPLSVIEDRTLTSLQRYRA